MNGGVFPDVAPGQKAPVLTGWSSDFSYGYYGRMLDVLASVYRPLLMGDAAARAASGEPHVILRHDIDVCPRAAMRMAAFEHERGTRSTYFFLVNSPLYSVEDPETSRIINAIVSLGHEVALHFDLEDELRIAGCSLDVVEEEIGKAAGRVASASGEPVRSVSFHRPIDTFLRGPLKVAGLVNAYAEELMGWYLSDSNACWREGEPIPQMSTPRHTLLQILVHPFWWGDVHMSYQDRLCVYHAENAGGAADLDERIFRGIGLRRQRND